MGSEEFFPQDPFGVGSMAKPTWYVQGSFLWLRGVYPQPSPPIFRMFTGPAKGLALSQRFH